jgi:GntR family transcriptional regulator
VVAERGRRPRLAGHDLITQPHGALYSLFALVEQAGLAQTSMVRVRDVRADGVVADRRLLELPRSVGALAIDRLGYVGDRPVEWRRTLIRGDRFSLTADFSHRTGYRLNLDSGYVALREVG